MTRNEKLFDRLVAAKRYNLATRVAVERLRHTVPTHYTPELCTVQVGTIRTKDDAGNPITPPVVTLVPATFNEDGSLRTKALVRQRTEAPATKPALETKAVFTANYDAMCRILAESKVGRRINMDQWRPTNLATGIIPGVFDSENVEIHATDGILGIFKRTNGEWFLGHIQRFTGKVGSLGSGPKSGFNPKPKKKSRKALLEELWKTI